MGASLTQGHANFCLWVWFMVGFSKPKLRTKFEVLSFSHRVNIQVKPHCKNVAKGTGTSVQTSISQGSVATSSWCGGKFLETYCWKFTPFSSSERILKIHQDLTELRPITKVAPFYGRHMMTRDTEHHCAYFTRPTWTKQDKFLSVVWTELATSQDCRRQKMSKLFRPVSKCGEDYWKQSWLVTSFVYTTDKQCR